MKDRTKELKDSIKEQLRALLEPASPEPPSWKLSALKLAIGFIAVEAKLEESEYGGFFDADTPSVPAEPEREEPAARKRKGRARADPNARSDGDDLLSGEAGGRA